MYFVNKMARHLILMGRYISMGVDYTIFIIEILGNCAVLQVEENPINVFGSTSISIAYFNSASFIELQS